MIKSHSLDNSSLILEEFIESVKMSSKDESEKCEDAISCKRIEESLQKTQNEITHIIKKIENLQKNLQSQKKSFPDIIPDTEGAQRMLREEESKIEPLRIKLTTIQTSYL